MAAGLATLRLLDDQTFVQLEVLGGVSSTGWPKFFTRHARAAHGRRGRSMVRVLFPPTAR